MGNKIAIIGVYFGNLPTYFPAWLQSCKYNPTIDFLIFSNQTIVDLPKNVKAYPMTIEKMQRRASSILGFEASLKNPYKCCDYKVLYGLLFQEYLSGYDYWGCCDFDLIFGDLQSFFDRYELYKYDRFLTLGHLCLYRNTEEVNRRYMCKGSKLDYKEVFTTEKGCIFDEFFGITSIYLQNNLSMFKKLIFADIAIAYHRYRLATVYPLDQPPKNYKHQVFCWEEGKAYRCYYLKGMIHKEEFIYVHFQGRPNYKVFFNTNKAEAFYITNKGFFEKVDEVTLKDIRKYNPYRGRIYEALEKTCVIIRNQAKRAKRFIRGRLTKNGQK